MCYQQPWKTEIKKIHGKMSPLGTSKSYIKIPSSEESVLHTTDNKSEAGGKAEAMHSSGRGSALEWLHLEKLSYCMQNKCTSSVSKQDKPRLLLLNKLWHHCVSWHMPIFLVVDEHGMKVSYLGIDNIEQNNWNSRNQQWAGKRQCCSTCWKVGHENHRDGCPSALANSFFASSKMFQQNT